jgi:hypothetical protein
MTAHIIRFPARCVVIRKAPEGGWLVQGERGNGWLHGSHTAAVEDAAWLGKNLKLIVREVT